MTAHDQDPRRPAPQRHAAIPCTPNPVQHKHAPQLPPTGDLRAVMKDGG